MSHWDLIVIIYIFIKKRKKKTDKLFCLIQIKRTVNVTDVNNSFIFATWSSVHLWWQFLFSIIENSSPWVVVEYWRKRKKNQLRCVTSKIRMWTHFLSTSSKLISAFLDHCPIYIRHELKKSNSARTQSGSYSGVKYELVHIRRHLSTDKYCCSTIVLTIEKKFM